MRHLAALALCALVSTGCFVLDEISKGQEIMEQHAPSKGKSKADAPEAKPEEDPGLLARAREWISGFGGDGEGAGAPPASGPPPHPDNVLVRCDVQGRLEFTRKFSCQRKGGKVLGPMHTSKR